MPRLDMRGRVQLPAEVRDTMALKCGVEFEVTKAGPGTLFITVVTPTCCVCGSTEALFTAGLTPRRFVCKTCAARIAKGVMT